MPARLTFQELRYRIARRLGDHWYGTLDDDAGLDATTLTLSGRAERTNYFANGWLRVNTDSDAEEHVIASSATTAPQATLATGLNAAQSEGTQYEIHKLFSAEDYNAFILDAILDAGTSSVLANLDYGELDWAAETWEYSLPSNFRYITEVRMVPADGSDWIAVPLEVLKVLPGIPKKLCFPRYLTYTTGDAIQIFGQGPEQEPTDYDSDLVQTDASFIMSHVTLAARSILADGEGDRAATSRQMIQRLQVDVELKRDSLMRVSSRPLPGCLVVP